MSPRRPQPFAHTGCHSRARAFCSERCIYFLTVHTDVPQSGQEVPLLQDALAVHPRVQTQPLTLPSDSLTSISWDLCHHVCITFLAGIPCRSGTLNKSLAHKRFPWPVWGPPGVFPVGHVHLTPGARAAWHMWPLSAGSGCSVGCHRLGKWGSPTERLRPLQVCTLPARAAGCLDLRLGVWDFVHLAL